MRKFISLRGADRFTVGVAASAKEGAHEGKHICHAEESECDRDRPIIEADRLHKDRRYICEKSRVQR